jgi:hypothetical protein
MNKAMAIGFLLGAIPFGIQAKSDFDALPGEISLAAGCHSSPAMFADLDFGLSPSVKLDLASEGNQSFDPSVYTLAAIPADERLHGCQTSISSVAVSGSVVSGLSFQSSGTHPSGGGSQPMSLPEPSVVALISLGGAALLFARRRH